MNNKQKGLISLAVMAGLTLVLVYTSEGIYSMLSSYGGNSAGNSADNGVGAELFETSAPGFGGDVIVETGIGEDGSIVSVEIVDCSVETDSIGQKAAPEIAQAIVEAQSLDVDAVSGATMTCDAVKAAVGVAIEQAGYDLSSFTAETQEDTAEDVSESAESETEEMTAPGTYEAVSGEVTVRVTLSQNAEIMAVTLVDFEGETDVQKAAAEVTKQIVESQSASVQGVEGQEDISSDVMDAVASILAGDGVPVE